MATQIKVKLIAPKYLVAFAFILKLIGTDDLGVNVYIDTSPPIFKFYFRFRFRNSEANEFGKNIVSLGLNFCVNCNSET